VRTTTLLIALSMLTLVAAPPALAAADAVASPTYVCNPNGGLVGQIECDAGRLGCTIIVFLLGGYCS
jgi:hypothetical protein